MTQPGPDDLGDPDIVGTSETLGAPERPQSSRRRALVAGVVTVAALGLAGGGYAVYSALNGGGSQPEEVVPANATAFTKVDFDPAAGQKVAALKLARKFPSLKTQGNPDDLKEKVITALFKVDDSYPIGLVYDTEIRPWIGDRVAVAILPRGGADEGLEPIAIFAYRDRAKMLATLEAAKTRLSRPRDPSGPHVHSFGYADAGNGFVIIATGDRIAAQAVKADKHLADSVTFRDDVKSLGGDQVALGWVDFGATFAASGRDPGDIRELDNIGLGIAKSALTTGRFVAGAHIGTDFVEVSAQATGYRLPGGVPAPGAGPGSGMVLDLPNDAVGVFSSTGLDRYFEQVWAASTKSSWAQDMARQAAKKDLTLPGDVSPLFGSESVLAITYRKQLEGEPRGIGGDFFSGYHATYRTKTADPAKASKVAPSLVETDPAVTVLPSEGGITFGDDKRTVELFAAKPANRLGDDPRFRKAVPNAADAGVIVYIDLARILSTAKADDIDAGARAIDAIGISATGGETVRATARVTFK